jgi:hypothetical protein
MILNLEFVEPNIELLEFLSRNGKYKFMIKVPDWYQTF